jgi:ribosome biogenesis GTPase A
MSKLGKRPKTKTKVNYDLGEHIHDNVNTNNINWFPGHMNKAIRQIKERLKKVDIVLEIRDARSPLATGNRSILDTLGEKSRLIIVNKTDLADPKILKLWDVWFKEQGVPYIFTDSFNTACIKNIVSTARRIVKAKWLLSNPEGVDKKNLRMMILGLPNTGKSTIINKLANRNASKAANKPGQTQHQLWVKVDTDLEILDTPGIMPPKIDKHEHGLWLSALNAIPDAIVKPEMSACFIVEHLLKNNSEHFKQKYSFEDLDLDMIEALNHIATLRGCIRQKGEYDYERVYTIVLHDFRSGELGPISLGIPPIRRTEKKE